MQEQNQQQELCNRIILQKGGGFITCTNPKATCSIHGGAMLANSTPKFPTNDSSDSSLQQNKQIIMPEDPSENEENVCISCQ